VSATVLHGSANHTEGVTERQFASVTGSFARDWP